MTRIILILAATLSVLAAAAPAAPKGNDTKGRYYFKKTCKGCHTKGAEGGEISPLTKTIAQWNTYFAKAKHGRGVDPLTNLLPPDQMLDVQTFLVKHAADSLQPETCGK